MDEKTPFNEWFDIHSIEHLKAYAHLQSSGSWPKHFLPADVVENDGWREELNARIVDIYIRMKTVPAVRSTEKRVPPEFS
jgi:hypothetical protein